ncbi:MAG: site-specific integrase [Patescibacteria group bacterium]
MSARKIINSWFVDIRFNRARIRKKSPENSKNGAQAYEAVLRRKLARGESIEEEKKEEICSFKDFTEKWLLNYVNGRNKPSEQRQKKIILNVHLIPFFGKMPIDKISSLKIEEYKSAKMKQGLANKTINNQLAVLGKCLHTAEEWEILKKAPKIKLFKVPPQKFDFLSINESQQLLNSAKGIWREMILIALKTGLRLGEITALDWSDVNIGNKLLTVRRSLVRNIMVSPKSNKIRYVPLTDEVCRSLNMRVQKKGFLFTDDNGQPLKAECVRRTLHRICGQADLRIVGWHTLRHTFASHLAEAGASIKAIQELLGHSDIKTTMRYAHLSPSALQETVKLLEPKRDFQTILGQYMGNEEKVKVKNVHNTALKLYNT